MKIAIILYRSKTLADGTHPLMVRISQLKSKKYFSTGLSCPASLWDFDKHTPKRSHPDRKLLEAILAQKKATYHSKLLELESEQKNPFASAARTSDRRAQASFTRAVFISFGDLSEFNSEW